MSIDRMTSYIYTGKRKAPVSRPHKKYESVLISEAAFIIDTSKYLPLRKSKSVPALYKYIDSLVLDYQLDCIHRVCQNPHIIYVTGYDSYRFAKNARRNEYCIVENQLYESTNSATNFKLGLNATRSNIVFWIDGAFIPTVKTMAIAYRSGLQSTVLYNKKKKEGIGLQVNRANIVTGFAYGGHLKQHGMYYFNQNNTARLKRAVSNNVRTNLFDYELFTEHNLMAIEDTSNSVMCIGEST